ncbi:hypothetical protein GC176_10905 [bacterium]|nr:hypothetical protein [bacterium]
MRLPRILITLLFGAVLALLAGDRWLVDLSAQEAAQQQAMKTPAAQDAPSTTAAAQPAAPEAGSNAAAADTETEVEPPPVKIPPPPPVRPDKVDIDLERYRVEIPIVFQPHPRMGPEFRQGIIDELKTIADRSIGPMWDLSITTADWITPQAEQGIERLTLEQIKRRQTEEAYYLAIHEQIAAQSDGKFPSVPLKPLDDSTRSRLRMVLDTPEDARQEALLREFVDAVAGGEIPEEKLDTASEVVFLYLTPPEMTLDKLYPVSVELDGSEYSVASREWDRASELITPVRRRSTIDRRAVATEIARLLTELFRPLVQIESADPVSARVRTMASEYVPADPGFRQVREGTMFIPLFRYLDRNRVVQKIQFLPWTYLTAEQLERTRANCRVDTGVKTPLGAFRRRRMELRALRINPELDASTLTLVPRRNQSKPLVGYLVAVYNDPPPPPPKEDEKKSSEEVAEAEKADEEREKPDVYRSDRLGQVTIPVDPEDALQWVFIRSGTALLAKFPIVVGTEANMIVECPDDTIRLDVEGQIALLQSSLVDTIAKREMVKAMIRNRMKKDEWDKVDESVGELKSLPGYEDFKKEVGEIQYSAIKRAQARKDRISESRIKKLGDEVLKIASIHLDEKKINDLIEEVQEQRPGGPVGRKKVPGQP